MFYWWHSHVRGKLTLDHELVSLSDLVTTCIYHSLFNKFLPLNTHSFPEKYLRCSYNKYI